MDQAIILQAQAMKAKAETECVPRENPPSSTMASSLSDFTRVNPPIYTRSMIAEDLEEECRESMSVMALTFQGSWSMSNKWRKVGKRSILG